MDLYDFKLSKKDFRDVRELLSIALEREFVLGLEQVEKSIEQWRREKPESSRDHYHELLNGLKDHRKQLGRSYDGLNKFNMEISVTNLLYAGILTDDDMKRMRPECREYFEFRVKERR